MRPCTSINLNSKVMCCKFICQSFVCHLGYWEMIFILVTFVQTYLLLKTYRHIRNISHISGAKVLLSSKPRSFFDCMYSARGASRVSSEGLSISCLEHVLFFREWTTHSLIRFSRVSDLYIFVWKGKMCFLMMARLYTGCNDIISLRNSYHGNVAATMGATAQSNWKFSVIQIHIEEHLALMVKNMQRTFKKSTTLVPVKELLDSFLKPYSIGSLGANSKVEKIHISNSNIFQTTVGVRIKTLQGGSGYAKDITYEHVDFSSVNSPIVIVQFYCPRENYANQANRKTRNRAYGLLVQIGNACGDEEQDYWRVSW